MTPITYDQTAQLLGVTVTSLRNAANRGVLTRLPRTGQKQPLIREQVMLFQGKPRLSLHVLSAQEKSDWARYAQAGAQLSAQAGEKQAAKAGTNSPDLAAIAGAGALLAGAGAVSYLVTPVKGVPQGDPFQLHQNLLQIIPLLQPL